MGSLISLFSLLHLILLLSAFSIPTHSQKPHLSRRNLALIDQNQGDQPLPKPVSKKKTASPVEQEEGADKPIPKPKPKKKTEEDTPIPKPKTKKQTTEQLIKQEQQDEKPISKPKNQTKPIKPKKSNSTSIPTLSKLNKTQTLKLTNSTKIPKNSTKTQIIKPAVPTPKQAKKANPANPDPTPDPIWMDDPDSDSDLLAEFRDLPTRIHQALLPDLKKISITSQAYIHKANKNMADNMKPFVGNSAAPAIAAAASCAFLALPLCLVTLLFYHLNSLLPLPRLLALAQAYLAVYFLTLSLTAAVTGLEPLRFFHATSPAAYAWTQAVQTLGYLMYLLVQAVHLVAAFSAGDGGARGRALAQMAVGLGVGCHYYAAVFHRAVAGEAPLANWKVHGVYAGCFFVICLCSRAEMRKKAYDGGDDCKKS